jgi:hypothetical protein
MPKHSSKYNHWIKCQAKEDAHYRRVRRAEAENLINSCLSRAKYHRGCIRSNWGTLAKDDIGMYAGIQVWGYYMQNRLSDLWVNPKPAYLRGLVVNYRKAFKAIDRLLVQAESFFDRHVKPRRKVV